MSDYKYFDIHKELDQITLSVSNLKKLFEVEELIPEHLYVCKYMNKHWMSFCFAEFEYSDDDDIYVNVFWKGEGPSGNLRECRHSYLGEDGYIFYINRKIFNKCFDWLEQYYDLD